MPTHVPATSACADSTGAEVRGAWGALLAVGWCARIGCGFAAWLDATAPPAHSTSRPQTAGGHLTMFPLRTHTPPGAP